MTITPAQYITEMRRIEAMRNEARHLGDLSATSLLLIRASDLNDVFWGQILRPR
jgi:hypothetical protein